MNTIDIIDYSENIDTCDYKVGKCSIDLSKSNLSILLYHLGSFNNHYNNFWIADELTCLSTGEVRAETKDEKVCLYINLDENSEFHELNNENKIEIINTHSGNYRTGVFVIDIPLEEIDGYIPD